MWNPALLASVMYRRVTLPSRAERSINGYQGGGSEQMNYRCFFSKRFLTRRFLTMMAAAAVIASAPLSRAEANGFKQTNLVSDGSVTAKTTDPDLVNPWGVAFFPGGPFWASDNAASPKGVSTLYDGIGDKVPLTV